MRIISMVRAMQCVQEISRESKIQKVRDSSVRVRSYFCLILNKRAAMAALRMHARSR